MHIPVLLYQILEAFSDLKVRYFVDGTVGGGGHSEALLEHHPEIKTLVGIDQDPDALKMAEERLKEWKKTVILVHGNFGDLMGYLEALGVEKIDGMLLDLGLSSMQLAEAEKGFSFLLEGPLDMRMNPETELTAEEIVNTWPEKDIGRVFREYGEEKQWKKAARAIVKARTERYIHTTRQLVELLTPVLKPKQKKKNHPLTLVFQALRICVNRELEMLKKVLPEVIDLLATGGRLAVISYHSLEDRIVKNSFRYAASDKEDTSGIGGVFLDKKPQLKIITRKPIQPTEEEIVQNPRSRSAKLRVVEKL